MKLFCAALLIFIFFPIHSGADSCNRMCGVAPDLTFTDPYTLSSKKNLLKDWPPKDESGKVHAVIEIPAGRTEKWEMSKEDGNLKWNFKKEV